jgi:hypothetical protein
MQKTETPVTRLNKHDRKILDRYTGYYTNFIESNTAYTKDFVGNKHNKFVSLSEHELQQH